MNPGEHEIMAAVERHFWWYRGLRDAIARCLAHADLALPPEPHVLDAGCGTGENLRFLDRLLSPARLAGFDLSPEALRFAAEKCPRAELRLGDICDPPPTPAALDLIVSLDVIYIPGVRRALPGLRRLVSALRPGGLLILNLPAYDWLYGTHDVAIHTTERYTVPRVRGLLTELRLSVERLSYRLCALFPAVVAGRLPGIVRARLERGPARSDLHAMPGRWTNGTLYRILALENRLIARGARLPWGSSVFAVGRKHA